MVSALIVYVVLCNVRSVNPDLGNKLLPPKVDRIGSSFQIAQAWNMFAPQPSRLNAWIAVGGKLKNGRELDLWLGERPLSSEKPVPVAPTYRNSRWRRYLMNLYEEPWKEFRVPFANYMWREWDARHAGDEQLALLDAVAFMEIVSAENPQPQWEKRQKSLARLNKPPE
jgi:hypothetical protein